METGRPSEGYSDGRPACFRAIDKVHFWRADEETILSRALRWLYEDVKIRNKKEKNRFMRKKQRRKGENDEIILKEYMENR